MEHELPPKLRAILRSRNKKAIIAAAREIRLLYEYTQKITKQTPVKRIGSVLAALAAGGILLEIMDHIFHRLVSR